MTGKLEILQSADGKEWRVVESILGRNEMVTSFTGPLATTRAHQYAETREDRPLAGVKHDVGCELAEKLGPCTCGEETAYLLRWILHEFDGGGEGLGLMSSDIDDVKPDTLVQPEITVGLVRAIRQVAQNRRLAAEASAS